MKKTIISIRQSVSRVLSNRMKCRKIGIVLSIVGFLGMWATSSHNYTSQNYINKYSAKNTECNCIEWLKDRKAVTVLNYSDADKH